MIKLLTLSAAVLCGTCVLAQNPSADSRLISQVERRNFNGAIFENIDSSVLSYSGNNGYDDFTKGWKYDSSAVWSWAKQFSGTWKNEIKAKQTLTNNRISSNYSFTQSGSTWDAKEGISYSYKNGLIDSTTAYYNYSGAGITPTSLSVNQYGSNKLIQQNIEHSWDGGSKQWQNGNRTTYHYNENNQADTIVSDFWVASTSTWVPVRRTVLEYSGSLHAASTHQFWDQLAKKWINQHRFTFDYNAKAQMQLMEKEIWNDLKSDWEPNTRTDYSYNAAGDQIEQKQSSWNGGWQNAFRTQYTYNAHHRITSEETQTWDDVNSTWAYANWDVLRSFYYEQYTNDVKTVASNLAEMTVFPVPAKDQITISASFKQMQPVAISIIDLNGRVVKQLTDQANAHYRKAIDVVDLPAGNYVININGTSEVASKMISVIH